MSEIKKNGEVISIQQLRGFAAMLVVLHHACGDISWLYNPLSGSHFGESGVDIFFVISGFIMVIATRSESTGEFWLKRLIRIAPLYWIATLLFIAMRISHFGEPDLNLSAIVKSILFIPYRTDPNSWVASPVLIPGWSLNIEMFFYILFGIGLTVRRPALVSGALILLAVAAGAIFQPKSAILFSYTRPILLEFVCGLIIGSIYLSDRLPRWLWPSLLIGLALIFCSDIFSDEVRRFMRGAGGVLIVLGALSFEIRGQTLKLSFARMLGDGSYAIYLFHTMVLMMMRKIFPIIPISGWPQFLLFIAASLISSAVVGYALHRWLELPVTLLIRRLLLPKRKATVPIEWRAEISPNSATPHQESENISSRN